MSDYTVEDIALGYAPVPPEMLLHRPKVTDSEIRVWCAFAMYRNLRTAETYVGVQTISDILDVDRTTVGRAVKGLIKKGFLIDRGRERDKETGQMRPRIFAVAVGKKPIKLGLVQQRTPEEGHEAAHDACLHRGDLQVKEGKTPANAHDASHDASHEAAHDAAHDAAVHTERRVSKENEENEGESPPGGAPEAELPDAAPEKTPEEIAGDIVAYLAEELDGADVPLLKGRKGRYGGDFTEHLKKGISESLLYKCADRIIERWRDDDHRKLTVEQAYEDVANGKPPAHVNGNGSSPGGSQEFPPSPSGVKEALLAHDVLARYAFLADRWDFTSLEQPPFKIEAKLGGDQEERWRNLDRVQSVARRAVSATRAAS